MLAEALQPLLARVPLPTTELGIAGELATAGVALHQIVYTRMQIDQGIARGELAYQPTDDGRMMLVRRQVPAKPADATPPPAGRAPSQHEPPARQAPPAEPAVPPSAGPPTAADLLAGMPSEPLASVTSPVQLNHSVTASLREDEDPEPALLAAFRPGEDPVPIDVLAASVGTGDVPLLDRLAPPPEVGGVPVARELG